jgi:hypothetical protein
MTRLSLVLAFTLVPVFTSAPARAADPAPTAEDARALYEKGEYNDALKLVARLLAMKGKAAEGLDRYGLLMLRAESHLRLKTTGAALPALAEAAKVAPDDESAAKARALSILIKRSKSLQYTPPAAAAGGAPKPIPITEDGQRADALKALYEGERAATKQKVTAATKGKTLPPIAKALKLVVPLRDLELAATGKSAETAETIDDLVTRAHKLMAAELDGMSKQTERIADRANEEIQYTYRSRSGGTETRFRRRGLDDRDTRELRGMIETCRQVIASCKELAEGFTEDDARFEDLEEQAVDTGERANDVLTDNYKAAGR